jgi:MHS family proline/betaine transporter-like MFS transporter
MTVTLLSAALGDAAMDSYGWRIPFLLAAPLGLVGLYIRLRLTDTPAFEALADSDDVATSPLREAVQTAWRPILQVIGMMIVFNVGYYVVFTYLPTYFIKTLHFSKTSAFGSITVACAVAIVLILPLAGLSDRIGRRPLLIAGTLAFAVLAYPLFLLLNSGSLGGAIAAHAALAVIESVYISVAISAGVELFATRVRYSAFSIGYNVCVAAFGGTTPYMVAWLTGSTGNNMAPAFYVIAAAVVSLVTVLTLRETAGRPLSALGTRAQVASAT